MTLVAATSVRPHPLRWVTAAPLWPAILGPGQAAPDDAARAAMRRPALLRFHSDRFMDDLQALLATDPDGLADHVATKVSHRVPPPGMPAGWQPAGLSLKLFQPVHGDFNLVAASLACVRPGLPGHDVDAAAGERAVFVLRRLESGAEYAWLEREQAWAALGDGATIADGEELFPLAPLPFTDADGHPRRLHVGFIPTASRDTFANSGALALTPRAGERTTPAPDPREESLRVRVTRPLGSLLAASADPADPAVRDAARLLVLDLATILRRYLPTSVWAPIEAGAASNATLGALWTSFASSGLTWAQALKQAWEQRLAITGESTTAPTLTLNLKQGTFNADGLHNLIAPVLRAAPAVAPPAGEADGGDVDPDAGAGSSRLPKLAGRDPQFVIRCAYLRPQCRPLHPDLVSPASEAFRIGGFFDLDAPARSVHIEMPAATSVKDLRKFRKSVTIALSDQLRQQMSRVTDAKKTIEGQLDDGEPLDIGMVCSLSIPIITIVALILLIMILIVLNIVFWWMPFFRICFPIVKKATS